MIVILFISYNPFEVDLTNIREDEQFVMDRNMVTCQVILKA